MKIATEYHVTVRCHGCDERRPRTGGKMVRRVRVKNGSMIPINQFFCVTCVEFGKHLSPRKGEGNGE